MAHLNENGQLVYTQRISARVVEAYYTASFHDRKIMDDLISCHTGWMPWNWGTPNVMHVEGGVIVDNELWFCSATSRSYFGPEGQKTNGVRWIPGDELLKHPDRWLLTTKLSGQASNKARIVRANSIIGSRYDFVGVFFDFILPVDLIAEKATWYCSKAWHYIDTGITTRISPRRRWKLATTKYSYAPTTIEKLRRYL